MTNNPYSKSLEARILAATPLESVVILYDGAIDAVRAARGHLASGNIRARSRSISKAVGILIELSRSLNFEAGGELSNRLAGVYGFLRNTLMEANFRQTDEGLATTEKLLTSLREAWATVSAQSMRTPAACDTFSSATAGIPSQLAGHLANQAQPAARYWSA